MTEVQDLYNQTCKILPKLERLYKWIIHIHQWKVKGNVIKIAIFPRIIDNDSTQILSNFSRLL